MRDYGVQEGRRGSPRRTNRSSANTRVLFRTAHARIERSVASQISGAQGLCSGGQARDKNGVSVLLSGDDRTITVLEAENLTSISRGGALASVVGGTRERIEHLCMSEHALSVHESTPITNTRIRSG